MATAGTSIARANFNSSWAHSNRQFNWSSSSVGYVYVCAASFVCTITTSYNLFQSGRGTASVDFYNRSTGTWQNVGPSGEIRGNGTDRYTFFHNRDAEANKSGINYRDNAASRVNHLFRIRWSNYYSNDRWRYSFYAGGVGLMTDNEYNNYAKNRLLKHIGRAGDSFHMKSDRGLDDATALSIFNPDNLRGTLIYGANDHYIIPDWV